MKPKTDNEILHGNSKSKGVRVVSFTTSKNLTAKSIIFLQRKFHNHSWTLPDGNIHRLIRP